MRSSSRGIANLLLTKQVGEHRRLLLAPIQMAAHGGHEFGSVGRPALAEPVRLDVLVQPLIGVQFRTVARHPKEPQSRRVYGGKARGCSGSVHRMPVHNQIDPAVTLLEQPLHELRKDGGLEFALKYHEGTRARVRDGRDHVAPEALARGPYHRSASPRRIACPGHMVTAQLHFVAPINGGGLPLGLPGNRQVFLFQPPRDGRIVPLVGAPHWLLRAHAPSPEVAPHGDERALDPVFPRNQARDRGPRPEIEWPLQLSGQLADDQRADASGPRRVQAPFPWASPPALERERPQARPECVRRVRL